MDSQFHSTWFSIIAGAAATSRTDFAHPRPGFIDRRVCDPLWSLDAAQFGPYAVLPEVPWSSSTVSSRRRVLGSNRPASLKYPTARLPRDCLKAPGWSASAKILKAPAIPRFGFGTLGSRWRGPPQTAIARSARLLDHRPPGGEWVKR